MCVENSLNGTKTMTNMGAEALKLVWETSDPVTATKAFIKTTNGVLGGVIFAMVFLYTIANSSVLVEMVKTRRSAPTKIIKTTQIVKGVNDEEDDEDDDHDDEEGEEGMAILKEKSQRRL